MEMEQLLDVAIDAFRKIYTDEPWFSWAGAWLSGHDRTAATAENLALSIDDVLGSQPPSTHDVRTNAALILRVTALNLTRAAAMVSRPDFRPSASEETIIAAARAALAIARKSGSCSSEK